MLSMNLSDITILNIKGSDYRCVFSLISKNEAINLMWKKVEHYREFMMTYKMGKEIFALDDIEIEKNKFYFLKYVELRKH